MTNPIIKAEEINDYCMKKPCAYETRPFGPLPICYRISGKIFAQLSTEPHTYRITLKTNPDAADFYRRAYPGIVIRGYHCPPVQQPYWNTVDITAIDREVLLQMIDEAYDEVAAGLSKKAQAQLEGLTYYKFIKTDGENKDFAVLCGKLDKDLDNLVGNMFSRQKYEKYNNRDSIYDVILIYKGEKAVGCGGYKLYDDETVELKRIFIDGSYRGMGLGKELIRRLEADARIGGYRYAVLETGRPLEVSIKLYQKMGYKIIENYGQYADMSDSVCMKRKI